MKTTCRKVGGGRRRHGIHMYAGAKGAPFARRQNFHFAIDDLHRSRAMITGPAVTSLMQEGEGQRENGQRKNAQCDHAFSNQRARAAQTSAPPPDHRPASGGGRFMESFHLHIRTLLGTMNPGAAPPHPPARPKPLRRGEGPVPTSLARIETTLPPASPARRRRGLLRKA